MKVIIAGGRDFYDMRGLEWALEMSKLQISEVVSGGCRGADMLGEAWAERMHRPVKRFNADWKTHGKAAGPIRNRQMAEYADAAIILPGGKGSFNMAETMARLGKPVFHVQGPSPGIGYHAAGFNWDKVA